jgi:hypothetical protein
MKRILIFTYVAIATVCGFAEGREDVFEFSHNRFAYTGMLTSSDSYQLEVSYHYMLTRTFGVGGSFGYWMTYFSDGYASGNDWSVASEDSKPFDLFLRPSLVLKSPAVRVKSVNLGLYAEPGMMINVPYTNVGIHQTTTWPAYEYKTASTSHGQWLAFDVRVGLYVNFERVGFSAGYFVSNHDIYSFYRHLSYRGISFRDFYPTKSFMQGAYLNMSYYF